MLRHATHGPWGESSRHLSREALERGLAELAAPKDRGELGMIVARGDDGVRETPKRVELTREGGVPGDAWQRDAPDKVDAQITMMRIDFGRLVANGQPLPLFGDNLVVDLDLSLENLPTGSQLRLGGALLEVTPEPHTGCLKYRQRFGKDALRLTADPRFRDMRLRGIYVKVVEAGEVAVGDAIEVLRRGA
jgi:MOSC domain-containing protein YiiM